MFKLRAFGFNDVKSRLMSEVRQQTRMKIKRLVLGAIWAVAFLIAAACSTAATFPTPQESDWTIPDFRFRSGEVIPELRIHFTSLPTDSEAVEGLL